MKVIKVKLERKLHEYKSAQDNKGLMFSPKEDQPASEEEKACEGGGRGEGVITEIQVSATIGRIIPTPI